MTRSEFRTLVLRFAMVKGSHMVQTLDRSVLNEIINDELAMFSELTKCIFRDEVPFALHPNVHTYDLRGNRLAAEVFQARSVVVGDGPLRNLEGEVGPVPLEQLRTERPDYFALPAGEPAYWSFIPPHHIRLTPAPSAAFIVSIAPSMIGLDGGYDSDAFGALDTAACKLCGHSESRLLFTSDPAWFCPGRGMVRTDGGGGVDSAGVIATASSATYRTGAAFGTGASGTSWTTPNNVFDGSDTTWASISSGLTTWLKVTYGAFTFPGDATITGILLDRVILRHRGVLDTGKRARMTFGLSLDGGSTVPGTLFTVACGDQDAGQDMGPLGSDSQLWGNTAAALKTAAEAGNLVFQCRRSTLLDEDQTTTREIAGARLTIFYTASSAGSGHFTLDAYVENSPPTGGSPNPPSVDRERLTTFVSGWVLHPRLTSETCPVVIPREYQRAAAAYVAARAMSPNMDIEGVVGIMRELDSEAGPMMQRLLLAERSMARPLTTRGGRRSRRTHRLGC